MEPRDIMQARVRPMASTEAPRIEFRSSTSAWLFQSGQGWLLLALAASVIAIGALFTEIGWQIGLGTLALLGLYCLWRYVENRTALYWLDDQRLFMRRGILMRSEEEIELYRIKDVKVEFSIIEQMFDNGTMIISSSDSSGKLQTAAPHPRTTIKVGNVRDARLIRGEIRDRVEAIRQKRGVRELDIG